MQSIHAMLMGREHVPESPKCSCMPNAHFGRLQLGGNLPCQQVLVWLQVQVEAQLRGGIQSAVRA